MHVVVAGGSGTLGRALVRTLTDEGHAVVVLSRLTTGVPLPPGARAVTWNPDGQAGDWAQAIAGTDAIVNLTGAGIADARWTRRRKAELRSSRLLPTRSLVDAVRVGALRPTVFVQHTAVGIYGSSLDPVARDESSSPGDDFLSRLAVDWEAEAQPVSALHCRLVTVRGGVVLMRDAGALPRMARPFRWFVGGPIGTGRQYLSWIHVDDWLALMVWALTTPGVSGILNATAPEPATNADFSRALGRALGRPAWVPVPGFVLRLVFGELAEAALLEGQRAVPRRTQELGFAFRYPGVGAALADVLGRRERPARESV